MILPGSNFDRICGLLESGVCTNNQSEFVLKLKILYGRALYGAICAYVPFAQDVFGSGTALDDLSVGYVVEDYIRTFGTGGDSIMSRYDTFDDLYLVPLLNMKESAKLVLGCGKSFSYDSELALNYIVNTPEERILDGVANFQNNDDFESWFNKTQN